MRHSQHHNTKVKRQPMKRCQRRIGLSAISYHLPDQLKEAGKLHFAYATDTCPVICKEWLHLRIAPTSRDLPQPLGPFETMAGECTIRCCQTHTVAGICDGWSVKRIGRLNRFVIGRVDRERDRSFERANISIAVSLPFPFFCLANLCQFPCLLCY